MSIHGFTEGDPDIRPENRGRFDGIAAHPTAVRTNDGNFGGFVLPSSSGFIYEWEAA